jgi:hypothetical protein
MEQKTRVPSEQQSRKESGGEWNRFRGKEEQERSRKTMEHREIPVNVAENKDVRN